MAAAGHKGHQLGRVAGYEHQRSASIPFCHLLSDFHLLSNVHLLSDFHRLSDFLSAPEESDFIL